MPPIPPLPDSTVLPLLKGVSRSFYLSIRLLPRALRQPVALGYLLARASDTLADAPGWGQHEKVAALTRFQDAVQGEAALPAVGTVPGASAQEQRLLDALPHCIEWLGRIAPADREDVRTVLRHITQGQRLDVERFGGATPSQAVALAGAAELDEYTYLVAGCVGEFWTRLGFRHLPSFATLPVDEMLELGRRYGMALQLINVLRDADRDLAIGRRYLPPGEATQPWLDRAQSGLDAGMRYVGALRNTRVRVASALPALIGARTLALLRVEGAGSKVPRAEVRALLWRTALTLGRDTALQREFRRARS